MKKAPAKKVVFISWSDDGIGHDFAIAFNETFLTAHPELEGFVSPNIKSTQDWFRAIMERLNEASYGIACLTPGAGTSTWFNFEVGLLYMKLKTDLKLLRFQDLSAGHPLAHLQVNRHDSKDHLVRLFEEMTSRKREVAGGWVNNLFPRWMEHVDAFERLRGRRQTQVLFEVAALSSVGRSLRDVVNASNNPPFHYVAQRALKDARLRFEDVARGLAIPAVEYPYYLIALQDQFGSEVVVQALAVVEHAEHFWLGPLGDGIAHTTQKQTERIFVFRDEDDFNNYYQKLVTYSKHYKVFAMSFTNLSREFTVTSDFSIITHTGTPPSKMLAIYQNPLHRDGWPLAPTLRFLTDREGIAKYEREFRNMIRIAREIKENEDLDHVRHEVFSPVFTRYEQVHVEMSRYIPIHEYDKYEEKHAYYVEMMDRMIERFRAAAPPGEDDVLVAELGAGTGLFTRRLMAAPDLGSRVRIDAIELDGPCHHLLKHKPWVKQGRVRCWLLDSRKPLPGSYSCIFTSFADHHIHPKDKKAYFLNIKEHLQPEGRFIVGDEFLRSHNRHDPKDREAALDEYHLHIIGLAEEKQRQIKEQIDRLGAMPGPDLSQLREELTGYEMLAKLERMALESGKENQEVKLSCREYESYLREAGFEFEKELIGPQAGSESIGGVYVYVAWPAR